MLKIENIVYPSGEQWQAVIMGARNPMNSWDKSDSGYVDMEVCEGQAVYDGTDRAYKIGRNDLDLLKRLSKAGADHRKYLRMLPVICTITTNHTLWAEFDTYKVGVVRNSCSKMHKIHSKEFIKDDFSHEGIDEVAKKHDGFGKFYDKIIQTCEWLRKQFNSTNDKIYWRALIDMLPMGFNLKATVSLNYEVLANMYHARKNHKMTEWVELCQFIEMLPYSELITGDLENDKENLQPMATEENK